MRKSQPGFPRSYLVKPRSRQGGLEISHVISSACLAGLSFCIRRMNKLNRRKNKCGWRGWNSCTNAFKTTKMHREKKTRKKIPESQTLSCKSANQKMFWNKNIETWSWHTGEMEQLRTQCPTTIFQFALVKPNTFLETLLCCKIRSFL